MAVEIVVFRSSDCPPRLSLVHPWSLSLPLPESGVTRGGGCCHMLIHPKQNRSLEWIRPMTNCHRQYGRTEAVSYLTVPQQHAHPPDDILHMDSLVIEPVTRHRRSHCPGVAMCGWCSQ